MRSRIYTIISGHFKSWYRSKSNIFWTIAFPLLLIVLFGAIFGSGSTKFDLYVQNKDLVQATPTPLSQGYVSALNNTGAFDLHMVPAEQTDPVNYVKSDAQPHNRGQRLLVVPVGFASELFATKKANISLYIDQSDQASQSLKRIIFETTSEYATHHQITLTTRQPSDDSDLHDELATQKLHYTDYISAGAID